MTDKPNNDPVLDETTILKAQLDTSRDDLARRIGKPVAADSSAGDSSDSPTRQRIQLLTGSRGNLSDEIDWVLFSRLRIVALLLFFGNAIFLVLGLIWPEEPHSLSRTTFWTHVAVTILNGIIGSRACWGCSMKGWNLRVTEALVFGGSAFLFFLFTVGRLLQAAEHGAIANMNGPWILLILIYALFMPSNWKRASLVILPMALCPVLAMWIAWHLSDAFRDALNVSLFNHVFTETFIAMGFAAVVAILGVRTIGSLRTEAFKAQQLGQYRLTRLLGSGGMGDVYEAEHLLLKRACAIKVIKPEQAGDATVLKRFEREVRSTAKLRHWNTVDIYDYGHTDDGTFYYVMEYLPGMNLQELVEQHGPMPESRVIDILTQACDALSEAHTAGMVHRDIKPANIFVTQFGQQYDVVKLLDFGLVRPLSATNTDVELTQQSVILGSPLFMPPEQASGDPADVRSDIYSLGVVAYFLLSGRTPFDGNTPLEVIMAHARKSPPALDVSHVSSAMAEVVMRCLEKEATDRFQSADELKQRLVDCRPSQA